MLFDFQMWPQYTSGYSLTVVFQLLMNEEAVKSLFVRFVTFIQLLTF